MTDAAATSATAARPLEERVRAWEAEYLWELATPSYPAIRREPEPDSAVRTPFQRDRDRIVHSKAFRRLKHKTQVFIAPEGDHYRTRLTHTLEACGISRTVARALGLNEDLTEAVGDGILNHTGPDEPLTLEGRIVRLVDRVAYINHDIDDALRAEIIAPDDLPAAEIELLGDTGPRRIDTLVRDIVGASREAGDIVQSEEIGGAMQRLRAYMFERVYLAPQARSEHERVHRALRGLFDHYLEHPGQVPDDRPGDDGVQRVTDYVAGMTDRYCIAKFRQLALPEE